MWLTSAQKVDGSRPDMFYLNYLKNDLVRKAIFDAVLMNIFYNCKIDANVPPTTYFTTENWTIWSAHFCLLEFEIARVFGYVYNMSLSLPLKLSIQYHRSAAGLDIPWQILWPQIGSAYGSKMIFFVLARQLFSPHWNFVKNLSISLALALVLVVVGQSDTKSFYDVFISSDGLTYLPS